MRSLQVRLPLIAIVVLAASLAFSAFVVFEALLLTGEARLDDAIEKERLRVREHIALSVPGALPGASAQLPTADELVESVSAYLERQDRSDEHMVVVEVGGQVLTTPDAPTPLELLRERGQLPAAPSSNELSTTDTPEGEVRVAGMDLRSRDGDAQAMVVGSLGEVRSNAFVALGRISIAAVIGLFVAGVLLWLVIRRVLRPLHDLASAARDAELEHLGERVPLRGRADEVGELAREFNRMLDRLEASVAEQRQFMTAVSHELRTPITVARGHLDLLSAVATDLPAGQIPEAVVLVRDELVRMQRLVSDLLTLGRSGDDDFVVRAPVRLREFFDELQLRVVGLGARGVVFEPIDDVEVRVDADRIAQAMLNLIVNADIHAARRTRTVVGALVDDRWVALYVSDDGGGVDDQLRARLFEPFVRSEETSASTGLGLSVVKAVTDAHGGEVGLDTGSSGTTVTIRVPHRGSREPVDGSGQKATVVRPDRPSSTSTLV